jgi:N utilization substance protein A
LVFYLSEIREGTKGQEIVVSRANNGLLDGLFKREVPEVSQGSVEIKSIVREPGNRAKIAVFSQQPGIDPVGSCVGQKGVRVQAIIQELGGLEKIDIIQWSDDSKTYIAQALSPAKNVRVEIDEKEKTAHVFVPQDELSLAIGKDGQNVRLAYKLTQYRIEIEGEGGPKEVKAEEKEEAAVENVVAKAEEEVAEDVADDDAKPVVSDEASRTSDVADEQIAETQKSEESTEEVPAGDEAQVSEIEKGTIASEDSSKEQENEAKEIQPNE